MGNIYIEEVLRVANRKDLVETGGGHNQKGVDFQRAWAVERMFELEESGAQDFLFLFESIQDVSEFDSPEAPSSVKIYQVKKRDRNEWRWSDLTHLVEPGKQRRRGKGEPPHIKDSPLGKLYTAALAFKDLACTGMFVSNSGCDLPLTKGRNAATSLTCDLTNLDESYLDALKAGLELLHESGTLPTRPALIHVKKTSMHPDDPTKHLIGTVVIFLGKRSPRHAGQAQALVEALLAKIGPLGAKTDTCATFEELRTERGYTRAEFSAALSDLEEVPDMLALLDDWLGKLETEGAITFVEKTQIRLAASKIFRLQVMGGQDPAAAQLLVDIDSWLNANDSGGSLKDFINKAKADFSASNRCIRPADFTAQFMLRALRKCVAQI